MNFDIPSDLCQKNQIIQLGPDKTISVKLNSTDLAYFKNYFIRVCREIFLTIATFFGPGRCSAREGDGFDARSKPRHTAEEVKSDIHTAASSYGPQTGATHYPEQYGHLDKDRTIKRLVVWYINSIMLILMFFRIFNVRLC